MKRRSIEIDHFHAPSISFPLHYSPIKVGNLRVAHPLKGIRSQGRPAPRGAIENEPVLRIELLSMEEAGRISREFQHPLGTCTAFGRAPSKRRSSSSRTSMRSASPPSISAAT